MEITENEAKELKETIVCLLAVASESTGLTHDELQDALGIETVEQMTKIAVEVDANERNETVLDALKNSWEVLGRIPK